jgi:hypothetical protein
MRQSDIVQLSSVSFELSQREQNIFLSIHCCVLLLIVLYKVVESLFFMLCLILHKQLFNCVLVQYVEYEVRKYALHGGVFLF